MESKLWARVKQVGAHGLRRGAWYAVVNNNKPELVILDVNKRAVPVNRGLLELAEAKPERWSVVSWRETERGARRASDMNMSMTYCVCPACRGRQHIEPADALQMTCEECGGEFRIDWEHTC